MKRTENNSSYWRSDLTEGFSSAGIALFSIAVNLWLDIEKVIESSIFDFIWEMFWNKKCIVFSSLLVLGAVTNIQRNQYILTRCWHCLIHFHSLATLSLKCCLKREFSWIVGSLFSNKGSLSETNLSNSWAGSALFCKAYSLLTVLRRNTHVVSSIFWWNCWNRFAFFSASPPLAYSKEYASKKADSLSNSHNDSVFELFARLWIVSCSMEGRFSLSAPSYNWWKICYKIMR